MRKFLIVATFIFAISTLSVKAQLGYGFHPVDIGFGFGYNKAYTDAETIKSTASAHLNIGYNFSPFTNFVVEYQNGKLSGGDALTTRSGRQFTNSFNSVAFRIQLQAGEFYDYSKSPFLNAFKNFYVASGVGVVFNNITEINRESIQVTGYRTDGKDKSEELYIPVRIGYEIKLYNQYDEPSVKIDIGYQHQFIMGDNLDGFQAGAQNDSFSQIFLGIKFGIGTPTSYRKSIVYQ